MGWLDYHQEFRLLDAKERNVVSIGIPTDDDPTARPVVPGWRVRLSEFDIDQRSRAASRVTDRTWRTMRSAGTRPVCRRARARSVG